ncbi:hypothetical protein NMY22_g20307 [Coprinellus aureogranulatus]|nr:hypothetical protein NMY22_g20307 [Coprinellus aureogranulatus]
MTCPRPSMPSMSASSVETMEAWIWSCFEDRTGARPSISSKKMIEGSSPTHFDRQSAPLRMKKAKQNERWCLEDQRTDLQIRRPPERELAARARARRVFPVPGGPWNRTPRGGVTLNRWNTSGNADPHEPRKSKERKTHQNTPNPPPLTLHNPPPPPLPPNLPLQRPHIRLKTLNDVPQLIRLPWTSASSTSLAFNNAFVDPSSSNNRALSILSSVIALAFSEDLAGDETEEEEES